MMLKNPLITTSLALAAFATVGSAAKPTFPSSKKDTIRELLKIPSNEDLSGRMLQPTQCVVDTLTLTTTGEYGSLFETFLDEVYEPLDIDPSSVCAFSYEKAMCYLDGSAILETAAPICAELGGTTSMFALLSTCPQEDGFVTETYLGLPGCLAPSCSSVEDFIENVDLSLLPSDDDPDDEEEPCEQGLDYWYPNYLERLYCTEDKTNEFELKEGNMKTCGWLSRRDPGRKAKICVDKPQAAEACPKSCCMCKENPRTRFFKKMNKRTGEVVTKPCGSLDKYMSTEMKMKVCNKSGGGGFPSARASCPQSCDTCPVFEPPTFDDEMDDEMEDDEMDDMSGISYGSGVVNGTFCEKAAYFDGCNPLEPDLDPESAVCMYDGTPDEMYCSYDVGPNACAICTDEPEILFGSGVVNGEECDFAFYYEGCDPSSMPEGTVCPGDEGDTLYCSYGVADYACAICLDEDETDDEMDDEEDDDMSGISYGSGVINGKFCENAAYFDGCNPLEPDLDPESMVCMNDGTPDEMYCSYDVGPTACAICTDEPEILFGSGVVNGEECDFAAYYEGCELSFMPEGTVCPGDEGDAWRCSYGVADYACATCLDEDETDDETADDDQPEVNYGSGAVNGESCNLALYYDGVCDSSLVSEGSICFDDGQGTTLYCSYELSDSACAICLDGMEFNRKLLELKTSHP